MVFFLVTIAITQEFYDKRKEEYRAGLDKIFSYGRPVIGIVSETDKCDWIESYPFHQLIYKTSPHRHGKSYLESYAIQQSLPEIRIPEEWKNQFVIKMSGRYLLADDFFFEKCREAESTPTIDCVVNYDSYGQVRTFCFGSRWKNVFEPLYRQAPLNVLVYTNVERYVADWIRNSRVVEERVDSIHIYANICNEGIVRSF